MELQIELGLKHPPPFIYENQAKSGLHPQLVVVLANPLDYEIELHEMQPLLIFMDLTGSHTQVLLT